MSATLSSSEISPSVAAVSAGPSSANSVAEDELGLMFAEIAPARRLGVS